jgi:hypothetical protein
MVTEFRSTHSVLTVVVATLAIFAYGNRRDDGSMNTSLDKETFWLWVKQAGGSGSTYGNRVTVDEQGNAYVAGFMSGSADFDRQILRQRGELDILIVKYRPDGSIAWIRQIGETGFSSAQSITIGKDGNVYVIGTIGDSNLGRVQGSARIGPFELSSHGGEEMCILCLSPDGEPLWTIQPGSEGEVNGEGIAVDGEGNCYVTGFFKGRFGDTEIVSKGKEDVFVAKYNKMGHLVWVRGAGGPAKDVSTDIAVDTMGNCYVTGYIGQEAVFDTMQIHTKSVRSFFLAKYDSKGALAWVRYASGNLKESYARGVAVDAAQNSYITGDFAGELVLGSTRLSSVPSIDDPEELYNDVFVVKFDPDGKPVWAVQGGGFKGDLGQAIAVDKTGNIYVTGSFYGNASFESIKLTGTPPDFADRSIFIAKYDRNGTLRWVKQSTGIHTGFSWAQSSGNGIAVNARGDCYVTGFFDIAIQFGSIKLEGFNSRNMFVAKINPR